MDVSKINGDDDDDCFHLFAVPKLNPHFNFESDFTNNIPPPIIIIIIIHFKNVRTSYFLN